MKHYISDLIPRIKKFSATLDQSSFILDKPWVVSSGSREVYEKLIFRRDGRVHMSSDGDVTDGKWEYLPEAESLLIDYGNRKRLYRHQFLDKAVFVLKPDGSFDKDDYYLLANENLVPNRDVEGYLFTKYAANDKSTIKLLSGKENELDEYEKVNKIDINTRILVDDNNMADGTYLYNNGFRKITVKDGIVLNKKRKVGNGGIHTWITHNMPLIGDEVVGLKDGKFELNLGRNYTIKVTNGVISEVKPTVSNMSWIIIIIVFLLMLVFAFFIS